MSVFRKWTLSALAALALLAGTHGTAFCDEGQSLSGDALPPNAIWLESLNLEHMHQGYGDPRVGRSVDNNPLKMNGVIYKHGLGMHSIGEIGINLKGAATRFVSMIGLDDEKDKIGSILLDIYVDGNRKYSSGVMRCGDKAKYLSVDLTGAKHMLVVITDGGDGPGNDHADLGGAHIVLDPNAVGRPESEEFVPATELKIASYSSKMTEIHGPRVVGATPGVDFLFLIPATGEGPLTYSAENLPAGLSLDPATGIISGRLQAEGRTIVTLKVRGAKGGTSRTLAIVGGFRKLAQTPPLGWNSWNVWGGAVDDKKVRDAADWMVKSGLAAHGYQYINIDDTWEEKRAENGEILCNSKFPDMKALCEYVHSKGLKIGIYSSPGPTTCGGFVGSYQHEDQDAATYAKWGIDYLKYDWCSYFDIQKNDSLEELQKPYKVMRGALDKCGRDIVYSLCQYGMGNVWEWGASLGANTWRTTGDIKDSWSSMACNGFSQDGHEKFAGPGCWNDPDMLVVGKVGWGPSIHPSRLSKNGQITHITLWSLLSSPMLIGCDMSQIDQFTNNLLTNDEVLEVNQDPLGRPAGRIIMNESTQVWARPLWDGTKAVGLFNIGMLSAKVSVKWSDLGLSGPQPVRNLWLRKSEGVRADSYSVTVPAQGAVLIKVGKPSKTEW